MAIIVRTSKANKKIKPTLQANKDGRPRIQNKDILCIC
jgi:hypothetical protein